MNLLAFAQQLKTIYDQYGDIPVTVGHSTPCLSVHPKTHTLDISSSDVKTVEKTAWLPIIDGIPQRPITSEFQAKELQSLGAIIQPLGVMPTSGQSTPNAQTHFSPETTQFITDTVAALDTAIRQFGTYTYYDKGPHEVMDFGNILTQFRSVPKTEAISALLHLCTQEARGASAHAVAETIISQLDSDAAYDFLFESEQLVSHRLI
jgi:hypothetical protein